MKTYQQVLLDEEAELALKTVMQITKLSQSDALKQGLVLLQEHLKNISQTLAVKPFDIYKQLDLGEGGYAIAPSTSAKEGVKAILQRKLQR